MKVGVKLHHHQRSKGPIDTFHIKRSPYSADYRQGCKILQAIRLHNHRPSQACLLHLATFVTRSWEEDSTPDKVDDVYNFMNHLLNTTGMKDKSPHVSLDESIQLYCSRSSPVPTVCPSLTLLFAVRYIERLKQSYGNVKGTNGCSRRLILIAYIMAAKFIHSNLKFIIDTNLPPLKRHATSSSANQQRSPSPAASTLCPDPHLSVSLPVSPPLSPLPSSSSKQQPELTDPTQYHYFHSGKTASPHDDYFHHTNPHPDPQTTKNPSPPPPPSTDDSMPSLSSMCSHFNYRIWRMENEFLHFLNEDLNVSDCLRLIEWAKQVGTVVV